MALNRIERRQRIHYRIRKHVNGTAQKPRMVVFRSNKQIYVQVVDDEQGKTLVAAASNDKELAAQCKGLSGIQAASIVGKAIAERMAKARAAAEKAAAATTVRATDVVNIRASASTEADSLGKASQGQEFTRYEEVTYR